MVEKYKEVEGNLMKMFKENEFDFIIHGCNCFNTMGAGIAKQIRIQFPQAFEEDVKTGEILGNFNKLGNYSVANTEHGSIVNLYSQFLPGRNLDYEALTLGLRKISMRYKTSSLMAEEKMSKTKVGLPLIGCGIAGGDWNIVSQIVRTELKGFDITVVKFKK